MDTEMMDIDDVLLNSDPILDSLEEEEEKPENIPPLHNLSASILVPFQTDILKDAPPEDRLERLEHILSTINYHRRSVRENLLYMFEREKKRIIQDAAAEEKRLQQQLAASSPGGPNSAAAGFANRMFKVDLEEEDRIIRNMEARAIPGKDYNAKVDEPLTPLLDYPATKNVRDKTMQDLLNMVSGAVTQLDQADVFFKGLKEKYMQILEKELGLMKMAELRPEER
ncbi:hypothetical protein QBC35DRAFT_490442 [Podospora australis]|uniref:Uncharacterized protein n=1 Tax=Podospora australis TaxID=1536484 RepID=A0AAN6WXX3_9PEZI|nr:hypothetical protein QBC35DRAFT_490442 [Podospora australis]